MKHCSAAFISIALASACAPPKSAWERTSTLCGTDGWGENDPSLEYDDAEIKKARFPSLECIDTIIDDLHIDAEAFEERDGFFMPEGREAFLDGSDPVEQFSGLGFSLYAARLLLMHDLGSVRDVEPSLLVLKDFVVDLRRAGGGRRWRLQESLYQIIVDDVSAIVPASAELEAEADMGNGVHASWNRETNTLSVYFGGIYSGYNSIATIFHEIHHDIGPAHIYVRNRSGDIASNGSYGREAAVLTAIRNGTPAEFRATSDESMASTVRGSLSRIEQYRTPDGGFIQPWDGFPWLDAEDR